MGHVIAKYSSIGVYIQRKGFDLILAKLSILHICKMAVSVLHVSMTSAGTLIHLLVSQQHVTKHKPPKSMHARMHAPSTTKKINNLELNGAYADDKLRTLLRLFFFFF